MTYQQIKEMLDKYGVSLALLGYFMYKDYVFTERVIVLMQKLDSYLATAKGAVL